MNKPRGQDHNCGFQPGICVMSSYSKTVVLLGFLPALKDPTHFQLSL